MEGLTDRQFGPYRIAELLGKGGMAAVFKAYQASMDRYVAIKVLPKELASDVQFVGRFQQEARVLARMQHPHILPVFDFGESDGYVYLVMPLIESGTLRDLLQGHPLPMNRVRDLISQLGDALDYAHSRGLVHRDVKPGNVLLDGRGNCLLADFGIAKLIEATSQFTTTGGTVGTLAYMSPEQGRGELVDARSDIYALGVMLYEMVTGRVPFEADTPVAVIFKHIQAPLPPPRTFNPDLPENVENVITKALAKAPQDRYSTASEFVQALQSAIPIDTESPSVHAEGTVDRATRLETDASDRWSSIHSLTSRITETVNRTMMRGRGLLLALLLGSVVAIAVSIALAVLYAPEYGFFRVPFASWFVFVLNGLNLVLCGTAFIFWRRYRRANQELSDLVAQPVESSLPVVRGHRLLDRPEFLTIVQTLFRSLSHIRYIQVNPLPGGYGGSRTVLTNLQRRADFPLPRAFVVKLGRKREMADEHTKFGKYVLADLAQAARFFRYATCEEWAGVAYEFVGVDSDSEIQSLHQFYQGYATFEVTEVIAKVVRHLMRAWYQNHHVERVDLYQEYCLLDKKREDIIGHVSEIVEENDPYRANFAAVEKRLQPHLKPGFCPDPNIPWYDPVVFVRTWSGRALDLSVSRSTVHGDLHARNVLVEIERNGSKRVWFIDFSHTGNGLSEERTRQLRRENIPIHSDRGHTLRDFCRLEAAVKFILTRLNNDGDLASAVAFEEELMRCGLGLPDLSVASPSIEALHQERFRKAWQAIREIRGQARKYLTNEDDLRPYYLGLLHATLPLLYYHPDQFESAACEKHQKRYALLSAGLLCSQL